MDAGMSFVSALLLLLIVTDPLGGMPLFVALMKRVPPERRLRTIVREVSVAFAILLLFMLFGHQFLAAMHLSQTSLGIAGGVILFLIALRMVFPRADGVFGDLEGGEPYIVPLAVPLLAGPSALATVLLLAAREPNRMGVWVGALALTMLICALTLACCERLSQILGERLISAIERLMGLILTAVAVQMLLDGLRQWWLSMPATA